MAYDIGPKIGIEGESEFRSAIKDINTNMKTLGTEMKVVASQFDKNDKGTESLTAKNKVLNKQIDEQKNKLSELTKGLEASSNKYGENDKVTQGWQQAVNKATAELNNMEREVDDNTKAMDNFGDEIKDTEGKSSNFAENLKKSVIVGVKAMAVATVAAGAALLGLAIKTSEYADEIDKLSERTGINREELQKWKYAAEQSGADIGKLEVGMKTLSDAMDGASNGSKKNIEAFSKLGVSMDDLKNKSQSQIFDEVMYALAEMPEGAARNALGNDVLGKSYTELMPLLNAGAGGMDELKARAEELGLVMSEESVKANVKFGDSLADVKGSISAVFMKLANEFLPILQDMLDWILENMPQIQEFVGKAFTVVSDVISTAYNWINTYLIPVFQTLFDWVKENWPIIQSIIKGVFDTISPLVKALWELFSISLLPIFQSLFGWVKDNFPSISSTISTAFGIIIDIATGVVNVFIDIVEAIKKAIEWLGKWKEKDALAKKAVAQSYGTSYGSQINGSFANGLDYVPFDGFVAELHKGEKILTAEENKNYIPGNAGITQNITINSPIPLSPSETARQVKNASQKLALGW